MKCSNSMRSCIAHPLVQCVLAAIRWIPVLFVFAILCWAYYAYVFELCFCKFIYFLFSNCTFTVTVTNLIERIVYLSVFHFLLVLFVFAYYQTIFTELARPPAKVQKWLKIKKKWLVYFVQFYVSREIRHELEMATGEMESRQVLERFVRHEQLPINTRAFDGCKLKYFLFCLLIRLSNTAIRYCDKCSCVKPDRCHHCSVCGCCIL